MDTFNTDSLFLSKIKTEVPGFDDLFYGGLRLPNNEQQDGLCIVIYGERGVSKSDLALQIMRGVNRYFKSSANNAIGTSPRFCSLTHRESELEKHYRGAEVVDMLDVIKTPEESLRPESRCRLCACFNELGRVWNNLPAKQDSSRGCGCEDIEKCAVCKLIRHGVIVYNSRSQSLHWNVGSVSDEDNLLSHMSDEAIGVSGIFRKQTQEETGEFYEKTPLQVLNDMREEVYNIVKESEEGVKTVTKKHKRSACVIEGFNAFNDDDLMRLPYADIIRLLRKLYAVSILVFDKRGGDLHLSADVIIHMRNRIDARTFYQFQELYIVKSDCQPHVRGWHKYRTIYGMKIVVYPSIPYLLMSRYETDDAVTRLEHESLLYPQPLLHKFQSEVILESKNKDFGEYAVSIMNAIFTGRKGEGNPYDSGNSTVSLYMVENKNDYDQLYAQVHKQISEEKTLLAVFLLGKTEQGFRKTVKEWQYQRESLRNIHCWEVSSAYIWPEVFASVVKQYIMRWKRSPLRQHLHIIVDDFANIGLYPLMNNEPLLPCALAMICKNATTVRERGSSDRPVQITLSMVCSSRQSPYYQPLCQLIESNSSIIH